MENVVLMIFSIDNTSCDCIDVCNCIDIFKSFEIKDDILDYSLTPITEAYDSLGEGEELYFLDSENKPVKVKSITKQPYKGRIYDVDPGDDAFIIQNSSGETVAYINSTGDLCIEDSNCNDNDAGCSAPGDGSFILKDSDDTIVSYINATGHLCLTGDLTENGSP